MVALLAGLGFTGASQAALIDRGNGLLYDNVLNVTWLQDANYAHTSGYTGADSTGAMDWTTATTWAANLNYNGLTGWRLASNSPVNGSSFDFTYAVDGTTDRGQNITSTHSELSYMYYVNLGLKGYNDTAGNIQSDYGIFGNGTTNGVDDSNWRQNNVGLVRNLQSYVYWSGSEYPTVPGFALILQYLNGYQAFIIKDAQLSAWAVRPGDVAPVPVPGAVWLFGSGLVGLLSFHRKKNKTADVITA